MKFIFTVQGEGRGHLTQALSMARLLRTAGHEVSLVLVGASKTRKLPEFFTTGIGAPVMQYDSMNFMPSASNRKPNMTRTVLYNAALLFKYFGSIRKVARTIRESGADAVINFYEMITGLAYLLHRPKVPMICIGHQYLFAHKDFGLPHMKYPEYPGLALFTDVTRHGAALQLALSFREMEDDKKHKIKVVPPLLRQSVLQMRDDGTPIVKGDYILGYMLNAGFSKDVLEWHKEHPEVPLRFFWDKWDEDKVKKIDETLSFHLIDDREFLRQMAGCMAYASTAGFESVCEAMYLGKPILMVPSHIEQEINAFDAMRSVAGVRADSFDLSKLLQFAEGYTPVEGFVEWVRSADKKILEAIEGVCKKNK
ncbi:MAG: glycosyltransferase family protein [Candidatus Cryptobacteroides sp.]